MTGRGQRRAALALAAFLVLTLAPAGTGCSRQAQQVTAPSPAVAVTAAARGSLVVRAEVAARVEANREVTVATKAGGRVAAVAVALGDRVAAGQTLVRLDAADASAQARQAEAGYEAALANLQRARAGARPEELQQAAALAAQAEASYQNAAANLQRVRQLYEAGAVSQQQYDAACLQAAVADQQYRAARQQLDALRAGPPAEVVRAAEAQVKGAAAALELARNQLAATIVTAPCAGIVAMVAAEAGEMVGPGMPVATIVDIDAVVINAPLAQGLVNRVAAGQTVEVRVPAVGGDSWQAEVAGVGPAADPRTRCFPVKLVIANPEHVLKPGMFAQVLIVEAATADAVLVPQEAVLDRGGRRVLFIIAGGVARERVVEVGLTDGVHSEIKSGVEAGESVVVSGQQYLSDGVAVSVAGAAGSGE